MKIAKVINNNVISTYDDTGQEVIVVGTGVGFQGKEGKKIDESKIQKIYRLEDSKVSSRMKELLLDLPMNELKVCTEIIDYARSQLDTPLNDNIYVTLTDHVHFAIERYKKDMIYPNPMIREVRTYYEKEYEIGKYAVDLIQEKLEIPLPIDDAVSIALHIVSAELDARVRDTVKIVGFLEKVSDIVREYFNIQIEEDSLAYERFITHLKFLSRKLFSNGEVQDINEDMQDMIERLYPEEYKCAIEIGSFIGKEYEKEMTSAELAYLTMHIERVKNSSQDRKEN